MDTIVKTISRILFPFIILLGIYIALHGHLSPGGAFQAGVIIATGFVLIIIVYTKEDREFELAKSELIDRKSVAGVILVILLLNLGFLFRENLLETQSFLSLWSGGFTPLMNVFGTLMIVTAITIIVYSLIRE